MNVIDFMKNLYFTNNFYRMPICLIKNIIIYKSSGLLIESCSIRLMKK